VPDRRDVLKRHSLAVTLALLGLVLLVSCDRSDGEVGQGRAGNPNEWRVYGGNAAGQRYSELDQISTSNVQSLKLAWRVDGPVGGLQTTPLVIGRTLYAYTTKLAVIALDASTGKTLWTFDSGVEGLQPSRGLTYWSDGSQSRLFAGIMDRLYALDPKTGRAVKSFGESGFVDLRKNLGTDYTKAATYLTSPGVIYDDMIIVGFRTAETKPAAPGAIRAYDVRTGKLRWIFHTIPRPGELGHETWPADAWKGAGGANNWAGMAVDEARGIIFVPTGSPADDFYGADRKGDNLFSSSLIALDGKTGKRIWHFQGVHHDIWDRDFPAPPALLTVTHGGRKVDAVAQISKQGFVFLFDRETGRPLFPITERPVPQSDVPGEATSPTQPFPALPAPFARQHISANMLTTRTPEAAAWARKKFASFRNGPQFTPLGVDRQTMIMPGTDGGAEWGGPAIDPRKGILYVNSNDVAWTIGLAPHSNATAVAAPGADAYLSQCAACHGADRSGSPPQFPPLNNLGARMTTAQVATIIAKGKGRMPAFPALAGTRRDALIAYVRTGEDGSKREVGSTSTGANSPAYFFTGYNKFLDPDGYPAVAPPWGTLNAIDLNTGRYLWKIPFGEYPELVAKGLRNTGSENYGGPIVTAGGLLFIGATIYDRKFRAFDAATGRILWQAVLPFAGTATPITYSVEGRQYVLIAASGGKDPKGPQGSAYLAFALLR
jgi:quinoprotein glucose dehydrogenase